MNDQSELLERYLNMLRDDPKAEPPPALDPDLALFARQMMQTPPAHDALRARVWQRAIESQSMPNGTAPNHDYFDEETNPMTSISIPKRRNTTVGLPLLTVVVAICVIAVWFFIQPPKTPVMSPAGGITIMPAMITATSGVTETSTPLANFTETPTANVIASATLTITPSEMATLTSTPFPLQAMPSGNPAVGTSVEITPAPFNSADGEIEGQLTGENPVNSYHFVAAGEGVVAINISANNLALLSLGASVVHAGDAGGGGGGGGGGGAPTNPLTIQSMATHLIVLPQDSVSVIVGANTNDPSYTPLTDIPYTLDIRYMDVIDLGANAFDGYSENTLNDFNPVALYKFEAEAGDLITFRATGIDGFDTGLDVYDATLNPVWDLSQAMYNENSGPGYDAELYRQAMPSTGVYYVLVRPGSVGFGSYRLQLTREKVPSLNEGTQIATFNSPDIPRFSFAGQKGQTVTVNVTLPADALDYSVQSVSVTLEQDGKMIDIFNHDSALKLTQAGIVLSAPVTLQSDNPLFVTLNASSQLSRPSRQQFHLEVSVAG